MKIITYCLLAITFNGCVLKSTVRKELTPIDDILIQVTRFNCGVIPDFEMSSRCDLLQMQAKIAKETLEQLGVKPSIPPLVPPVPPGPGK